MNIRLRKVICAICFCLVLLLSTTAVRTTWASPFPANSNLSSAFAKEGQQNHTQGNDTLLCTIEIVACNQINPSTTVPNGAGTTAAIRTQPQTMYSLLYPLLFAHHTQSIPWQVGPGGRGWVPTVEGYSEPTIKQISVACFPTRLPILVWYNWCIF